MDYEKKYKSLVEAVKTLKEANPSDEGIQNWVNDNVPELAESEDKRIRKWIIAYLENRVMNTSITDEKDNCLDAIRWLKNQGEQKAADIRTTGYWNVQEVEQKSATWSEEDEIRLKHILRLLNVKDDKKYLLMFGLNSLQDLKKDISWLKSLRPQNHWKPSNEQMEALNAINVTGCISYSGQGQKLINLYNDLKKLK